MAFRFSLEGVLRFRENVERIEELALNKIVQEIASVQADLDQAGLQQRSLREQREVELARGLPAIHLQEVAEQEREFNTRAEGLRALLQELERKRVEQLEIYRKAQQNQRILSEIRQQQRHSYDRDQRRQEQKTLDDLFLQRTRDRD